jgi:hypothetical protein
MISLRLAVPAVLVAAAVAGCFTYFVAPPPTPHKVEVDQRLPPTVPNMTPSNTATPTNIKPEELFQQATEAIQKQAPDALASAGTDGPPITDHILLPKRRPIPRP